ncbi:uncharacterized protein CC84DRAFT_1211354 [Paraphaeosphaeria sporulosa]|uniref:Uncharacterized protein n=1 Tax=Paraphaeosphaeria sporulosa TaxID=1460663 RepID=A0A177CXY7_9PLEO|nr:uncharacterized protein CC84DRAFT_1211354 [Paraphaeosphaeria sporulosa]OAG11710.1 hypothetical protein CC84DRAFT_1211354 [Paraphaeosphaeria sporulosa]
MYEVSCDGFLATLNRKNYIYVEAVNPAGNSVRHAGWSFRDLDEAHIAAEGPADGLEDFKKAVEGAGDDEIFAKGRWKARHMGTQRMASTVSTLLKTQTCNMRWERGCRLAPRACISSASLSPQYPKVWTVRSLILVTR